MNSETRIKRVAKQCRYSAVQFIPPFVVMLIEKCLFRQGHVAMAAQNVAFHVVTWLVLDRVLSEKEILPTKLTISKTTYAFISVYCFSPCQRCLHKNHRRGGETFLSPRRRFKKFLSKLYFVGSKALILIMLPPTLILTGLFPK